MAVPGLISRTAQENGRSVALRVLSATEKFNINEKAQATGYVFVPKEGRRGDGLIFLG